MGTNEYAQKFHDTKDGNSVLVLTMKDLDKALTDRVKTIAQRLALYPLQPPNIFSSIYLLY